MCCASYVTIFISADQGIPHSACSGMTYDVRKTADGKSDKAKTRKHLANKLYSYAEHMVPVELGKMCGVR